MPGFLVPSSPGAAPPSPAVAVVPLTPLACADDAKGATGRKLLLIGVAICAGLVFLTVTGRLRNSESHAEHVAISHSTEGGGWWEGFVSSWSMILVSEIGDKTFFIACLMAMRHPRLVVFGGAISALTVQTILSSAMGSIVPQLLPPTYTQIAAVCLFIAFGLKILNEARTAEDEEEEPDELQEARDEISKKEEEYCSPVSQDPEGMSRRDVGSLEHGRDPVVDVQRKAAPAKKQGSIVSSLFGPIFIQAFTLTFIAEWGDRSQIATIALAAAKNAFGVCIGGIVGHSICTGAAVILGQKVSHMLSPRHVNCIGGVLFLAFGVLTAYQLAYPDGFSATGHGLPPADAAEVENVVRGLDKGDVSSGMAVRAAALIEKLAHHARQHASAQAKH
eukprot:TRINITY_DN2241_c0_g1_i2.p1 TRINITY_DN2241_c0_g1~~TRINITY_DN2241_c0_g1_i2.p1  ORF type:complete len:391 (+),score=93.16 TRINITY_DN2241_c0_g1_i2:79-1251(+)